MSYPKDPFLRKIACPYKECEKHGKAGLDNIIWWSRKEGRYKCKSCNRSFTWFTEKIFSNKKHSPDTICEVLQLLAEGMSIRGISRVKRIKPETVIRWRREAAAHLNELEDFLLSTCELEQVQIDEIYTFIKKNTPAGRKQG